MPNIVLTPLKGYEGEHASQSSTNHVYRAELRRGTWMTRVK